MKKNLMFMFVAAVTLSGCSGGFKKGPGGMLYNIHTDKSGPTAQVGDFLNVNVILKNDADSVMFSTYSMGRPSPLLLQQSQQKGDIFDGFKYLSEGDSATIKICADSIFKKGQPKPPGFKGKYMVYEIKVEKLIQKGKMPDTVFQHKISDYFKTVGEQLKKEEPGKIQKYIADKGLKTTKTASGLNYVITKEGNAQKPVAGDTVEVNYTGRLLSGKIFDTNIKADAETDKSIYNPMAPYKPIKFAIGVHGVVAGWDEGLPLIGKGGKITLVVPSSLGYGEQGMGPIGPFTPMTFDIELVDIIKPNPNAPKPAVPVLPAPQAQAPAQK